MSGVPGKYLVLLLAAFVLIQVEVKAQRRTSEVEFGPVVRAYLGYLRDEQEVVDDRVSRREISATYYRRNSNRIKALRQTAIRLARDSHNDYLPELEAVAADELRLLFENPPAPGALRVGEVVRRTFRYLGSVRSGELFYTFARLDPYEQGDLGNSGQDKKPAQTVKPTDPKAVSRSRRATPEPSRNPE